MAVGLHWIRGKDGIFVSELADRAAKSALSSARIDSDYALSTGAMKNLVKSKIQNARRAK